MINEIQELKAKIRAARAVYFSTEPDGPGAVADDTYDAWVDRLTELEADCDEVTAVGASPVSSWVKVSHTVPMGSLDKAKTMEQLTHWVQTVTRRDQRYEPLLVSEKLDGMSISLRYDKGKLVQALTRGDGVRGEDITQNVLKMQGVLPKIPRFTGSLRGEIVIHRDVFAKHFPDKSSTRNTATGTAKRLDGVGCEHLSVYIYRISDGFDTATESEMFEQLVSWGLLVPNWWLTAMTPGVRTPHDIWLEYQQSTRDSLKYDIDGLVISLNDLSYQLSLGETDNCPNGAVAYKFAPIARESTVRKIVWQVGSIGRITPVVIFDPVHILGSNIKQSSLYNYEYIKELGLDVDARILVVRANDVIPRIASVTLSTGTVAQPPTNCPVCGSGTVWEGRHLVCPDKASCPAQATGRIQQWIKEQGILEWGATLIEKVVSAGLVTCVADLYRLTAAQLAGLDRMGERSADVALSQLQQREFTLDNLLGGLSIPNCATSTIRFAMDAGYDTLEKLKAASEAQLESIPNFGPVKAASLFAWLRDNEALLNDLLTVVSIRGKILGVLTGKSVCFTGTMINKRAELEKMVEAAGGKAENRVTKTLTYLVIADPASTTSKAVAARKNGTVCISEEMFLALVNKR